VEPEVLSSLLGQCPACLLRLDAAGQVVESNQEALERLGEAARPGAPFAEVLGEAGERARFEEALADPGRDRWHLEVRLPAEGGDRSPVVLTCWRLPEGGVGVLGQDLGELVHGTHRLVQAEKLAGVGRIAAQLAHQLNTPLGSILLSAQALEGLVAGGEYETDVAIVVEETRRCQRIVRRLQNFSRTAGVQDDRVNLCHLFHRVFQILGHSLEAAGVTLKFRIARGRYLVQGDPAELEHAIFALIENAMDASPRGATITVLMELSYPEGRLTFRVLDEGPGLPEGVAARLFEPFYTTKPEGKGTGLGLAIARRILEEHGGELAARDRPEGGAEFCFRLPLSPALLKAYAEDPGRIEVRAIPFKVLQARARGEFGAGCETVGVLRPGRGEPG